MTKKRKTSPQKVETYEKEEVAKLKDELQTLKEKMKEMEEELEELRAYKAAKEEEEEDDDVMKYDFACCEHIDESGSVYQPWALPSHELYCTQCDCNEPCSYGDFEERGIYWWRCEKCIWQNGNAHEMLCGDCVDKRLNPPTCAECGDKDQNLTEYKDERLLCEYCTQQCMEDEAAQEEEDEEGDEEEGEQQQKDVQDEAAPAKVDSPASTKARNTLA
jgi:hypothetical protein